MSRNKLILIAAVGLAAVFATPAFAQTQTTGAIQGTVQDENGNGIAGVTVVATSAALQGAASELTDASGAYYLSNLPPGSYELMFYYQNVKVRHTNVIVSLGKLTRVNAKLTLANATGEEIVIEQKSPVIDVGSAKQGTTITQDYTKHIPAGRTYEGVLGAAAGSQGDALGVSFSGSTSVENSYVIDGINTTGLTYGTVGSPLINDFIQEIEVITGGYNAEFGRSTGGVVNVITKSGSNEFHGSVFSNIQPWEASREDVFVAGSSIDADSFLDYSLDFGFDLGGPIIKDKLWFYVGFAPRLYSATVLRTIGTRVDRRINDFDYSASQDGDGNPDTNPNPGCELSLSCEADGVADVDSNGFEIIEEIERQTFTSSQTQYMFTAKVNFAVNPDHQGQVSFIGIPTSGRMIGVTGTPTARQIDYEDLTTDLAVKWTSKFMNNRTEVDVVVGWHRSRYQDGSRFNGDPDFIALRGFDPRHKPATMLSSSNLSIIGRNPDTPESADVQRFCADNSAEFADAFPTIANCPVFGYMFNSAGFADDTEENRYTGKIAVTQRVKAAGHHQIKIGADFENNHLNDFSSYTGGKFFRLTASGNAWEVRRYAGFSPNLEDGLNDVCGFIDDGMGNLTPRMCHYLEDFRRSTNTFNWSAFLQDSWQVLPNLTVNAGLRYEVQILKTAEEIRGVMDPTTGDTVGANALVLDNLFAPRIGVLYDWTREGRSKVYANWGRFYESIPMDINNRAFGGETFYFQYWRARGAMNQCTGFDLTTIPVDLRPGLQSLPEGCPESGDIDPNGNQPVFDIVLGGGDPALGLPPGFSSLIQPGLGSQYLDEFVAGVEYELLEDFRVGLSYQNRRLGRVIEDVSVDGAHTYIISNPGEFSEDEESRLQREIDSEMDPDIRAALEERLRQFKLVRLFDKPRRDYNAVQLTAYKRFSRNFFVQGSYTFSILEGNYPGLFAPDNGQLDPNITSQYDLIELLANRDGRLPHDRPHSVKLDGYYRFDLQDAGEVITGVRLRAQSGSPIDTLGAHPVYGSRESFILPRGTFGRTDFQATADLRLQYGRNLGKQMKVFVYFDVFNVFNSQTQAAVDEQYTLASVNPIVGGTKEDLIYLKQTDGDGFETGEIAPKMLNYAQTSARLAPLAGRFGVRLEF